MRRRRLLIIATVVLAIAGGTTIGFAMSARSTPTAALSGPIADDSGFSFIYSHVAPGDAVTIASLVVTNTGTKSFTVDRAIAEGASNVVVLGTYALDPSRYSPGEYRGFPPIAGGTHLPLRRLDALGPLAPGATMLLATGLRLARGQSVGSISGIRLVYRASGSNTRQTTYGEATELLAR
jgi:hypothetical protein